MAKKGAPDPTERVILSTIARLDERIAIYEKGLREDKALRRKTVRLRNKWRKLHGR